MDMVWLDTMFPGIDAEEGWEENMKRVVNYDYLLKEYLDWQLKHLTTDNFDPTDWANVTADIISMAAGSVDLTAYYDKSEVDAKAQLILETADDHADAKLLSYYTKDEADAQAALTLETAEGYTNTALGSYYTKTEIGDFTGYQTAVAALQAYADSAVASIDLSAYYTSSEVDGVISDSEATVKGYADGKIAGLSLAATGSGSNAQLVLQSGGSTIANSGASLALSVTNNSNGYSTLALTSGGVTLATSGNITLGGKVVFTNTDISSLSSSGIYQGVTEIIGDTVTTSYINALDVTAKTVKASASISSPLIIGGSIFGATFYAAQNNFEDYFHVSSDGWELFTDDYQRASLKQGTNILTLSMGNTTPGKIVKYYGVVSAISNSNRNYLWIGGQAYPWNTSTCVGLLLDLSNQNYKLYGTAM